MTHPLDFNTLWRDTVAAARRDFGTYVSVAAAFVLLPQAALAIFGPPPPQTTAELTPRAVLLLMVLPSVIAAVAQLAIAKLIIDASPRRALNAVTGTAPGAGTVGAALRAALLALPGLVLALLLLAVPLGVALLLIVPGFYILGRMALVLPVVITEHLAPFAALERSWALTQGNGWRALAFILSMTALLLLGTLLAGGLGAALGSVLTLALGKGVGGFAAVLVGGAAATVFAVFNAAASATLYLHLRD